MILPKIKSDKPDLNRFQNSAERAIADLQVRIDRAQEKLAENEKLFNSRSTESKTNIRQNLITPEYTQAFQNIKSRLTSTFNRVKNFPAFRKGRVELPSTPELTLSPNELKNKGSIIGELNLMLKWLGNNERDDLRKGIARNKEALQNLEIKDYDTTPLPPQIAYGLKYLKSYHRRNWTAYKKLLVADFLYRYRGRGGEEEILDAESANEYIDIFIVQKNQPEPADVPEIPEEDERRRILVLDLIGRIRALAFLGFPIQYTPANASTALGQALAAFVGGSASPSPSPEEIMETLNSSLFESFIAVVVFKFELTYTKYDLDTERKTLPEESEKENIAFEKTLNIKSDSLDRFVSDFEYPPPEQGFPFIRGGVGSATKGVIYQKTINLFSQVEVQGISIGQVIDNIISIARRHINNPTYFPPDRPAVRAEVNYHISGFAQNLYISLWSGDLEYLFNENNRNLLSDSFNIEFRRHLFSNGLAVLESIFGDMVSPSSFQSRFFSKTYEELNEDRNLPKKIGTGEIGYVDEYKPGILYRKEISGRAHITLEIDVLAETSFRTGNVYSAPIPLTYSYLFRTTMATQNVPDEDIPNPLTGFVSGRNILDWGEDVTNQPLSYFTERIGDFTEGEGGQYLSSIIAGAQLKSLTGIKRDVDITREYEGERIGELLSQTSAKLKFLEDLKKRMESYVLQNKTYFSKLSQEYKEETSNTYEAARYYQDLFDKKLIPRSLANEMEPVIRAMLNYGKMNKKSLLRALKSLSNL